MNGGCKFDHISFEVNRAKVERETKEFCDCSSCSSFWFESVECKYILCVSMVILC